MKTKYSADGFKAIGWTLDAKPHKNVIFEANEISDEYHSMHELYEHRMALNIALFNSWVNGGPEWSESPRSDIKVMKSKLHYDGTMFEGYFIVMAVTVVGQISYHYRMEHWDKFQIPVVERTPEWDGHNSADVVERLIKL